MVKRAAVALSEELVEEGDDAFFVPDNSTSAFHTEIPSVNAFASLGMDTYSRVDEGAGRGRGSHLTKPAWMT